MNENSGCAIIAVALFALIGWIAYLSAPKSEPVSCSCMYCTQTTK